MRFSHTGHKVDMTLYLYMWIVKVWRDYTYYPIDIFSHFISHKQLKTYGNIPWSPMCWIFFSKPLLLDYVMLQGSTWMWDYIGGGHEGISSIRMVTDTIGWLLGREVINNAATVIHAVWSLSQASCSIKFWTAASGQQTSSIINYSLGSKQY